MNTIAIYTRKSKFTGKGESIENQIEKCKKFIEFKFNIDSENVNIFMKVLVVKMKIDLNTN